MLISIAIDSYSMLNQNFIERINLLLPYVSKDFFLLVTLSLASISQLAAMSISMISRLPLEEAQWMGALPYWASREKAMQC